MPDTPHHHQSSLAEAQALVPFCVLVPPAAAAGVTRHLSVHRDGPDAIPQVIISDLAGDGAEMFSVIESAEGAVPAPERESARLDPRLGLVHLHERPGGGIVLRFTLRGTDSRLRSPSMSADELIALAASFTALQ